MTWALAKLKLAPNAHWSNRLPHWTWAESSIVIKIQALTVGDAIAVDLAHGRSNHAPLSHIERQRFTRDMEFGALVKTDLRI